MAVSLMSDAKLEPQIGEFIKINKVFRLLVDLCFLR